MTRITLNDWRIINAALALYEADHENEEPDPENARHSSWLAQIDMIVAVRTKVHERIPDGLA